MKETETLFIELTQLCNLKCIHCGYKNCYPCSIDYNIAIQVISKCLSFGLKRVVLTGGEPTLYKDLNNLLHFCKSLGLETKLTTNGSQLDTLVPLLDESLLDIIVVSIDAFDPMTYIKIRGRDNLPMIWDNYRKMSDYRTKFQFSYLIQRENFKELISFLHQCSAEKVPVVNLLVPHFDGDFTHQLELNNYYKAVFLQSDDLEVFQREVVPDLLDFYRSNQSMFKFNHNHISAIITYLTDNTAESRSKICSLPLKTIFLYSDGTVRMCPYHLEWSYSCIDDLLHDIQNKRMKAIFEGSKKTSLCRHCLEVPIE